MREIAKIIKRKVPIFCFVIISPSIRLEYKKKGYVFPSWLGYSAFL
jgi:hypothetical protein